jgi:geranylgeranyl diphosphate synthase, type II
MGNDPLTELTRKLRDAVETRLAALMPPADQSPANLHCAMRYTLLAPGKRARALLAMLAAKDLGRDRDAAAAISPACALEMVHTASLILDDLPAMDNASLRRGLPANHMLFGEATAILAAIGLLNRAFGVIAEDASLGAAVRVRLADILSRSVGSDGLVAGQELDLKWSPAGATRLDVELVHARKTAALFSAAAEMGAVVAGAGEHDLRLMRDFGMKLGLAFQILDDLLDATASRESAGKDVAQDGGKPSLVLSIGLEAARDEAQIYIDEADRLIRARCGDGGALRRFAMTLIAGLELRLEPPREMREMHG